MDAPLSMLDTRVKRAKIGADQYYDSCSLTHNINELPPELLSHIFSFVCRVPWLTCHAAENFWSQTIHTRPFLKEPIIISHVCSQWRQIAIHSASLWSHIDLFEDQLCDPIFSARLETFSTRSAQALLDLHILNEPKVNMDDDDETIFPFLLAVAPRVQSLTIDAALGPCTEFCRTVLDICAQNCIPGVFTELSIDCEIAPWEEPIIPVRAQDELAPLHDESLWQHVKILRINPSQVKWPSKVYSGLTELRLTAGVIHEPILISILRSNLQLSVLELSYFRLEDPLPENISPTPVHLNSLEVLKIGSCSRKDFCSMLRFISPGPKTHSLSITNPEEPFPEFSYQNLLRSFVSRSNITQLSAVDFTSYAQLAEVLSLTPAVRTLAVDSFKCDSFNEHSALPPDLTLDSFYVCRYVRLRGGFGWPTIENFVKKHNVRKLTLYDYDFGSSELGEPGEEIIPTNLYTICPVVNVIPFKGPLPIEDWY